MKSVIGMLLAPIVLLMGWCEMEPTSDFIAPHEVQGRYVADFLPDGELAYIDLLPDSLFVHVYRDAEGGIYADSGKWRFFERPVRHYGIRFDSLIQRYPRVAVPGPSGLSPRIDSLKQRLGGQTYYHPEGRIDTTRWARVYSLNNLYGKVRLQYCYRPRQEYVKEEAGARK